MGEDRLEELNERLDSRKAADSKSSEISQVLSHLDKEISELEVTVNNIDDKFSPVLKPVIEEQGVREEADSPYGAALAQVLDRMVRRCASARRHLEDTINRGEL